MIPGRLGLPGGCFTASCTGLDCTLDGSGSSEPNGRRQLVRIHSDDERPTPRSSPHVACGPARRAVDADLDTLATALYARTDELLKSAPERLAWRPAVGYRPADL